MASKQPIIWAAIKVFIKIFRSLPHKTACRLGAYIGSSIAFFTQRKVNEAIARCVRYFGVTQKEAKKIVKGSYRHFGMAAVEFIRQPINCDNIDDFVTVHNEEYLREAVNANKGVFIITAHIGNWEYAAVWCVKHGYPIYAFGAEQRDERITRLIEDLRTKSGVKVLDKQRDIKKMIAALKSGVNVAVPIDQDARTNGVVCPFLDGYASTPVGAAKIASRLGCKVIPGFCIRRGNTDKYDLFIEPTIENIKGEPFGKDLQASMDACNEIISSYIRKYPNQWLWMYPRWESMEEGQVSFDMRH